MGSNRVRHITLAMLMHLQQLPAHHRRMTGFVLAAILIHSIILIGLWDSGLGIRSELPDWVNIKLVAGLDESIHKQTQTAVQQTLKQPKPVESNKAEQQKAEEPIEKESQQAEAQHFVKADSRPFEHHNPKPFYPAAARKRGMQGIVLLRVEVDVTGRVKHIELKKSSRYRLLDHAALSSVKRWRFIPAKKNNNAVASVVEVPIRFELKAF